MTNFIWPSNQARAENHELNRVCEYLEEVLDERDAATTSLARLKAKWQFEMLQDVVDRSPPDLDGEGWKYLMQEIEKFRRLAEE